MRDIDLYTQILGIEAYGDIIFHFNPNSKPPRSDIPSQ